MKTNNSTNISPFPFLKTLVTCALTVCFISFANPAHAGDPPPQYLIVTENGNGSLELATHQVRRKGEVFVTNATPQVVLVIICDLEGNAMTPIAVVSSAGSIQVPNVNDPKSGIMGFRVKVINFNLSTFEFDCRVID